MQDFNYKHFLLAGLVLGLISAGLLASLKLSQNRQTTKAGATSTQVNIDIISPRLNAKVLGKAQIKATTTYSGAANLRAVFQIDGKDAQALDVSSLSQGKFIFTGKWDSSKQTPGQHQIEVLLYSQVLQPPELLGSNKVSVTVVTP